MRIVIIDDEPMILDVLKRILRKTEHEVITFESELDAFDYLSVIENKADLILMDLHLQESSGELLFSKIRGVYPDQKIVAITGSGLNYEIQQLLDMGMVDFIEKPFGINELNDVFKKHFS